MKKCLHLPKRMEKVNLSDVTDRYHIFKLGILIVSIFLCTLLGQVFFRRLWLGIVFIPLGVILYRSNCKALNLRERNKYETQFIDFLLGFSFALQAGFSSENAFDMATDDLSIVYERSKLVKELKNIGKRIRNNERLGYALVDMAERFRIDDMKEFAYVYEYAAKMGGRLTEIIKKTSERMKEKHELKRQVVSITSGKKLEARVLSAMPILIIFYLQISLGNFMDPLYKTALGMGVMFVCSILYTISIYWIKRIVDISA